MIPSRQANFLSRIPSSWHSTLGNGVKIGICDSGCKTLPHLKLSEYKMFGKEDYEHGTAVTEIIAAQPSTGFAGLAYRVEVYFAAVPTGTYSDYKFMLAGLDWLSSKNVDVLNLSWGCKTLHPDLPSMLERFNKAVIISAQNAKYPFPASLPCCISTGIEDGNIVLPAKEWQLPSGFRLNGSSAATAYMSGVVCLAKGFSKTYSSQDILNEIRGVEALELEKNCNMWQGNQQQKIVRLRK